MQIQKLSVTWLGLLAASILIGGTAQATPMVITIGGTVTYSDTVFVPVGTALNLDVFVDSLTANEDTPPDFLATGDPGTLSSFLIVAVTGTVFDVTGTGGTNWAFDGELDLSATLPGVFLPITTTIDGSGMTPGQILPDFTGAVTGTISVDLDPLAPLASGMVLADVVSVSVTGVPEPSTALLVGFGLAGFGVGRRYRLL
jgi:hypothetical protein